MFATVIKNTILIFFVICIGYFLVDNHLNEMRLEQGNHVMDDDDIANTAIATKDVKSKKNNEIGSFLKKVMGISKEAASGEEPSKAVKSNETTAESDRSTQMRIVIDPELKELYNYVFNDMKATDDLNAMFSRTEVRNVEKDFQIVCDKDQNENDKIAKMCSNPIEDHHKSISYDHISTSAVNDQSMYDFVDKHN
jgi:hypothetical protein